jgi:hypothetical protein
MVPERENEGVVDAERVEGAEHDDEGLSVAVNDAGKPMKCHSNISLLSLTSNFF